MALLVRRLRERLQANELVCIGTSATNCGYGLADRNKTVAEVASKLFGASITEQDIIGETLERVTDPLKDVAAVQADLAGAVARTQFAWADFDAFRVDPLSIWVELNLGIELPDNEPPRRAKPMTIQAASEKLAKDAGCEIEAARLALQQFLVAAHEIRTPQGRPPFAFKLHQFISCGRNWRCLKRKASVMSRWMLSVSLQARQDEGAQLYPVHFCRDCGQNICRFGNQSGLRQHTPRAKLMTSRQTTTRMSITAFYALRPQIFPIAAIYSKTCQKRGLSSRDQPKIKITTRRPFPITSVWMCKATKGMANRSGTSPESSASV